jgi:hypothetical protein
VVCGPMGQRTDRAHIVSWDLGVGAPGSSGRRLSSGLLAASSRELDEPSVEWRLCCVLWATEACESSSQTTIRHRRADL